MRIVIVIPTYNESQNIIKLLNEIYQKVDSRYQLSVVIVDDNSTDGTAAIVEQNFTKISNVYVLQREKKMGIGSAYIAGFEYAIENLNPEYIIQMDADFSHNPQMLTLLIEEALKGYGVVIGSRYIDGASIDGHWPLIRKLNSKLCNLWSRNILSLQYVSDCTGGFKIIEVAKLKNIKFENFFSLSYSFQIALIYCLVLQDVKIKEIPIYFKNRLNGKSKMKVRDTIELLVHVVKLKLMQDKHLVETV